MAPQMKGEGPRKKRAAAPAPIPSVPRIPLAEAIEKNPRLGQLVSQANEFKRKAGAADEQNDKKKRNNYERRALCCLTEALKIAPSPELYVLRAQLRPWALVGKKDFERALLLDPDHVPALVGLGMILAGSTLPTERSAAIPIVERMISIFARQPSLLEQQPSLADAIIDICEEMNMVALLSQDSRPSAPISLLEAAVEKIPGHAALHLALANQYANFTSSGRKKAIAHLQRAIELDPANEEALLKLSGLKVDAHDPRAVIRQAGDLITLDPENYWSYMARARARAETGDLAGALEDAQQAVRLHPKDVGARAIIVSVKFKQGLVSEALAAANGAILLAVETRKNDIAEGMNVPRSSLDRYGPDELSRFLSEPGIGNNMNKLIRHILPGIRSEIAELYSLRGQIKADIGDLSGSIDDINLAIELVSP